MRILFKRARIIDGKGETWEDGFITIEENKIGKIGKGEPPAQQEGFKVVDVTGLSILPGLIDCHVHFQYMSGPNPRQQILSETNEVTILKYAQNAKKTLEAGITTIRDCGAKNHIDFAFRKAVQEGICSSPRLILSGRPICITGGHGWQYGREADGPEEVRKAAREQIKAGADNVKFMATGGIMTEGTEPGAPLFSLEELKPGIEEARKAGKITAAHAQGASGIKNAVRAGISSIEHGYYLDDEGIELMIKERTFLVATAAAVRIVIEKGVEKGVAETAVRKAKEGLKNHIVSFKKAYKAGVKMALGTDAGMPFNFHGDNLQELFYLVEMGVTVMDAIKMATINGAKLLNLDNLIGSIEEGKLADLVILKGNPLDDIGILTEKDRIKWVIQNGKVIIKRK